MLRVLLLGAGALGAFLVGKKALGAFQEKAAERGGGNSPIDVLARGLTHVQARLGPWSMRDLTLGLLAISKVTEKDCLPVPGQPAELLMQDAQFLERAQHWRAMAEAVYAPDPASFSLLSHLPESAIVGAEWTADPSSLRPAFAVCVDAPYSAVILAVRGTSEVIDMLVNSGASMEPFLEGVAHGGFAHATEQLLEEVAPIIDQAFAEHGMAQTEVKLMIVGHSLGAAIGIMAGLKLREKFPNLECWAFSTPACLTLELAQKCRDFVTSFISNYDIVPRFSLHSVELLRKQVCSFDWDHAEKILKDDEDWKNIKSASEAMRKWQETQKGIGETVQSAQDGLCEQMENVHKAMGNTGAEGKKKDPSPGGENYGSKDDAKDDEKPDKEERDNKREEKEEFPPLYAPGRILVLAASPPGCGKMPEQRSGVAAERKLGTYPTFEEAKKVQWVMHEADQLEVEEIVVSPWCVTDHMLGNLSEGIYYLQRQCSPALPPG